MKQVEVKITNMWRNKKGVTTLLVKTNEVSQEEFDKVCQSEECPKVKVEFEDK